MTDERLSDRLVQEPLSCYVLLNEPLKATFDELLDAADEDYPGPNWGYQVEGETLIDTRRDTRISDTTGTVEISCTPGRLDIDWDEELHNSQVFFPRAAEAVDEHTDYLRISFQSRSTSRKDRVKAARQMTCLAAVLAKLPIASAVYVPSAEKLVRPELWVEAADPERADEIPVLQWITVGIREYETEDGDPLAVSAYTIGLAPFFGQEFVLPRIKCPGAEAEIVLAGIVSMAFEESEPFEDGAAIGFSAFDKSFRVRHCAEGVHNSPTDQIWFLHTTCDINDRTLLGNTEAEEAEIRSRTRSDKFRSELAKRVAARV